MGRPVSILAVCAVLSGCSGDDGTGGAAGGGSAGSGGDEHRFCDAHLAWDKACAAMETDPRDTPFWGETECLMRPWHYVDARYLDAASQCFASLPCDLSDDTCSTEGFVALGIEDEVDLADDAEVTRCVELSHTCADLSEDTCFALAIFTEAGRRAAVPCLDLDCAAIADCLHDPG